MAQILIRKRPHFAEETKPASWSDMKWAGRPLRGDIVEIRENGYWRIEALGTGQRHWPREAYALIQITNVAPATIMHLMNGYDNATEGQEATIMYKRRYRFSAWDRIPWVKNIVTVGGQQVEEWYYIRANLGANAVVTDKLA